MHTSEEGLLNSVDKSAVVEIKRFQRDLFKKIGAGDLNAVRDLLSSRSIDARRSLFNQFNEKGYNLLHAAICTKSAAMVGLMLEMGADIKAKTNEAKPHTPLELAVITEDDDVI